MGDRPPQMTWPNALEMDPRSTHLPPSQLAINSAKIGISYPPMYDEPKIVRVRGFRRVESRTVRHLQNPPLRVLDPVEENLDSDCSGPLGLVVGFAPLDFDYLGADMVFRPKSPYQGLVQKTSESIANTHDPIPVLKWNDHVALVVARFWSYEDLLIEHSRIDFSVLLDPDEEGICVGHRIFVSDIFFVPQYRDDCKRTISQGRLVSKVITSVMKRHFKLVTNAGGKTSIRRIATPDTAAEPRASPPKSSEQFNEQTLPSRDWFFETFMPTIKCFITSRDPATMRDIKAKFLRPLIFHNCANLSPSASWRILSTIMAGKMDEPLQEGIAMRCLNSISYGLFKSKPKQAITPAEIHELNSAILARGRQVPSPFILIHFVRPLRAQHSIGWPEDSQSKIKLLVAMLDYAERCNGPMVMDPSSTAVQITQVPRLQEVGG
ncbi:hypothetical protein K461DRAFT_298362 [Myriangium duriaei CBS 260.36]|uniref:Uncharacterized protein n=1 Tax=Myriangium duriaei CBS 260.36 TaxID=1168546 RepID=A0A9P4IQC7_9PEZI|nr:hypothetical protein K461DRAFT_298362 [Myriangium duriaei CBS 260.36]